MDPGPLVAWFQHLPMVILVFTRVTALFMAGPVLGELHTPPLVKVLLGLAIALIIAPLSAPAQPIPLDAMFLVLVIREVMVGISLGFLINIYFQGIQFGGDLINRHAGFSAAENFNPDTDATSGPIGDIMHLAMVSLFFITDGHHLFFAAMARSYEVVPIGAWQLTPAYSAQVGQAVTDMTVIAVAISFPVLAATMAVTICEGILTRAVPQINVMSVSFAVKTVLSLGVLYAGLPAALAFMGSILATIQQVGMNAMAVMK